MFDSAIVEHHFTPYMRDYDIVVDVPTATPDGKRSYIAARCFYRFTHCVMAYVTTSVEDRVWRISWGDEYIDYKTWEKAGAPEEFVWGVCFSSITTACTRPATLCISFIFRGLGGRVMPNDPLYRLKLDQAPKTNCLFKADLPE